MQFQSAADRAEIGFRGPLEFDSSRGEPCTVVSGNRANTPLITDNGCRSRRSSVQTCCNRSSCSADSCGDRTEACRCAAVNVGGAVPTTGRGATACRLGNWIGAWSIIVPPIGPDSSAAPAGPPP